jgi:molybdopterin-containing oxidoreductase family iron-sulfur binding subunit
MPLDRRKFVKLAGLTVVGLASGSPSKIFGQDSTADTTMAPATTDAGRPLTARRWAMVVNVRECMKHEDCHDCRKACDHVHNIPDFDNPKDEIKWIWKESFHHAFHDSDHEFIEESIKHAKLPVLCNHCDNPPCVGVCPTGATFQRESDGIVMMDWHRCIGCRYCVAGCPYGSRSFNWRDPRPFIKDIQPDFPTRMRGVVEKCTFCEERLAHGKLPACVESCKYGCLTFGDLEDPESKVRELLHDNYTIRRKPGLGTQPEIYYIV